MGKQAMRQAARLAASQVHAKRRRERAERDRRLEKLENETPLSPPPNNAPAPLAGDDHRRILDGVEAVQWCAGGNQPPGSGPASPANRASPTTSRKMT